MRRTVSGARVSRPRCRRLPRSWRRSAQPRASPFAASRSARNTSPAPSRQSQLRTRSDLRRSTAVVFMFLNGGAMRDGPLHGKLCGAAFVAETYSTPSYRFYSVDGRFPAMDPVDGPAGRRVAGEVYDVSLEILHDSLLPAEPAELELGVIRLASGAASLAM